MQIKKSYEWLTLTLSDQQAGAAAATSLGRRTSRVGKYDYRYSDHCFNCALSSTFCRSKKNEKRKWEKWSDISFTLTADQHRRVFVLRYCTPTMSRRAPLGTSGIQTSRQTIQRKRLLWTRPRIQRATSEGRRTWIGCRWKSCAATSGWSKNWRRRSGCGSARSPSPCRTKSETLTWKTQNKCITSCSESERLLHLT